MKQVLRKGLKDIVVRDVPDPIASPRHVLIRPIYSLISSGTETADLHREGILREVADNPSHLRKVYDVMMKTNPVSTVREVMAKFSDLAVLGYSGAGVIVDKASDVKDLNIGQRVAYGGEGTGHGETLNVGRNLAARIPDGVTFQQACFTTLGAIAINAMRQANIQVGEYVAVVGLGLIGQLVSQVVRCQGGIVIATDLQESRVALAIQSGADFGVLGGESAIEEVLSLTDGRGADTVIVAAASKTAVPVQAAIRMCRDRGRLVIVGIMPLEMPHSEMYMKELKLFMARAYGPGSYDENYEKRGQDYPLAYVRWTENRNMSEFLRLVAKKRVTVEPLVSHEFALDDASSAYDVILDPKTQSLGVLLRYPAHESIDVVADFKPQRRIEIDRSIPASTNTELKFAVIGAGNLVRWEHLPAIRKISNARVRAIFSNRGAKGIGYGIRFKADYATSDYEEILRDNEIDVVLVASRHRDHAKQTIAALKAGKHVFVEKPMAIELEECRGILKAVRESGKHVSVGFNRRFAPCYVSMKEQIAKRTGEAVINIRMNATYMKGDFWGASSQEGGAIVGEAVHLIDLMRFLLNSDPISVSACSLPTEKLDPIGENNIVASFKFLDGSIGNVTYCTIGSNSSAGELVEVFASGVAASSEDFKSLVVKKNFRNRMQSRIWAAKGYSEQMQSFVRCLHEGVEPTITADDGAKALVGSLLMLESARNDGAVQTIDFDTLLCA